MNKEIIKILESEKKVGYTFKNVDKKNLADELMKEIGNKDGYIRDFLIYPCLFHLFYDNHFKNRELEYYAKLLISDEYLFYDMGNEIEYSVLKRTFSLLQIVVMVNLYNKDRVFSREILMQIYRKMIDYFNEEKILTGYDMNVGWVDSVPHSADVFVQLMQCKELRKKELENIFNVIADKFMISHHHYTSNEDERCVNAIMHGLNRSEISKDFVDTWLKKLASYQVPKEYPNKIYIKRNINHLLRSLYFRVIDDDKYKYIKTEVEDALKIIENRK